MRMKFNKTSQLLLVSAASILVAGVLAACSDSTVDYVYVASSQAAGTDNYGEINVYTINQFDPISSPSVLARPAQARRFTP